MQTENAEAFFAQCDAVLKRFPLAYYSPRGTMNLVLQQGEKLSFYILDYNKVKGYARRFRVYPYGDSPKVAVAVCAKGFCPFYPAMDKPPSESDFRRADYRLPRYTQMLSEAVPYPRDRSLFGYLENGSIRAVVMGDSDKSRPVYALWTLEDATLPEFLDPNLVSGPSLQRSFWEQVDTNNVILLDDLIAGTRQRVWYMYDETERQDYIFVPRDLGPLKRGVFARNYKRRSPSKLYPSIGELLRHKGRVDLSIRLQRHVREIKAYQLSERYGGNDPRVEAAFDAMGVSTKAA